MCSINMAVFLVVVLITFHVLNSTATNQNLDLWSLKIINELQLYYRSNCLIIYLRPNTEDDASRYSDLQRTLETFKEIKISALVIRLDVQNPIMQKKSLLECNRPIHVLPSDYKPSLVNISSWNSRYDNKKQVIWLQFLELHNKLDAFFDGVDIPFDCEYLLAQRVEEAVTSQRVEEAVSSQRVEEAVSSQRVEEAVSSQRVEEAVSSQRVEKAVTVTEVFRVRDDLPLQTFLFATWRPNMGLRVTELSLHQRRQDLQGIVLKASVIREALLIIDRSGSKIHLRGYSGKVFHELTRRLNFTIEYTEKHDSIWGTVYPNGTVDGLARMIADKEIDLAANPFFYTTERQTILDFTVPVLLKRFRMFIRIPNKAMFKWTHFFAPFSRQLWLAIGCTILFISLLINVISMLGNIYYQRTGNLHFSQLDYPQALFTIIGIFLQQGYNSTPKSGTIRVILIAALLTSSVVLAAYSGTLISFITINKLELPFNDMKELLRDTSYKVGVFGVPSEFHLSEQNSNGSTDLHLLSTRIHRDKDPPKSILEGLLRVCSSKFVLLLPVNEAYRYKEDIPCQLTTIPKVSYKGSVGFPLSKNSPYRTIINYMLMELESSGVLKKFRLESAKQKWPDIGDYVTEGADLENVVPIIVLLLAGVVAAAALLVAECATNRLRHRHVHSKAKTRRIFLP